MDIALHDNPRIHHLFLEYGLPVERRRKIIYWQGLVAIWGAAIFFVYSEWNQVTVAVVAVGAHLLWRWAVKKMKAKE